MTNPSDPNDPKWKLTRWASPTRTQTSAFMTLPYNYRDIRIIPSTTEELKSRRRHRVIVMHNFNVYREPNSSKEGAFEVKLTPGQNTLAVEVLSDFREGEKREYAPPQLQFDYEKVTLMVELTVQFS